MSGRTRALLASLAVEWPDLWGPAYRAAVAAENAHADERDRLFGFTATERAWFRAPLTQTEG